MNFVVYTAIANDYDYPRKIPKSMKSTDFICYCNTSETKKIAEKNGWKVRSFPSETEDSTRICRDIKVRPHIYLPNYSASLWVDGTVQITNLAASELFNLLASKTLFATFKHPSSRDVHEEGQKCKAAKKDDAKIIDETLNYIFSQGFPKAHATYETCVIFRFHNDQTVKNAMEKWHEIITYYSRRDQLSLGFSLWLHGLKSELLNGSIRGQSSSFYRGRHRNHGLQGYLAYIDAYSFNNPLVFILKKAVLLISRLNKMVREFGRS